MTSIKDVAKIAGVSVGTVSNVINNRDNVSDKKREAVNEAIEKLNFSPTESARKLATGKTNIIALIIPEIAKPFYSMVIDGVEEAVSNHGYELMIYTTKRKPEMEKKYLRLLNEKKVDGVLLLAIEVEDDALEIIEDKGFPVVLLERESENISSVTIDNKRGAISAVKHLISLGHKDIAMINGPENTFPGARRYEGYLSQLKRNNIEVNNDMYFEGEFDNLTGERGVESIFRNSSPTAIFAASDTIAYGVINKLREYNKRVPEDVSVIGYDDIPTSVMMSPKLTTMRQPVKELGIEGVKLLLEEIESKDQVSTRKTLLAEIVVRESTKEL